MHHALTALYFTEPIVSTRVAGRRLAAVGAGRPDRREWVGRHRRRGRIDRSERDEMSDSYPDAAPQVCERSWHAAGSPMPERAEERQRGTAPAGAPRQSERGRRPGRERG